MRWSTPGNRNLCNFSGLPWELRIIPKSIKTNERCKTWNTKCLRGTACLSLFRNDTTKETPIIHKNLKPITLHSSMNVSDNMLPWKNEISEGKTIPNGMLEQPVLSATIINENHHYNTKSAKNIQRLYSRRMTNSNQWCPFLSKSSYILCKETYVSNNM